MQRLALVVVSLVVVGGCHQDNPESCELPSNAGMGVCPPVDAPPDTTLPPECMMSSQCMAKNPDKAVCDTVLNGGTCVQCTTTSQLACKAQSLACVDDACASCTRHADCVDSNVCMPDGTCAKASDVAYLDGAMGTDQMMCTKDMPCNRIEQAAMAKKILKITGTLTDRATLDGRDVLILADPGAKLTPTQDGAALDIRKSKVQIYDLEISHTQAGAPKDGISLNDDMAQVELTRVKIINNTADGARVNAGHLTCTRCRIAQNTSRGINLTGGVITISQSVIQGNSGGGILIGQSGKFQIVGNFIFGNGSVSSLAGGIAASVDGDSTNRMDFNSISHNNATGGVAPGINCISGMTFTAKFNILWNNGVSPFPLDEMNVAGCGHTSSSIGPFPNPPGISNFPGDPGFLDEAGGDLHLKPDSGVRQKAPASAPELDGPAAKDIDGEVRASPVDLGADQTPR